jgi:hypothetical protein
LLPLNSGQVSGLSTINSFTHFARASHRRELQLALKTGARTQWRYTPPLISSSSGRCAGPEKNDETPLHLAARHAPLSTVKLLVSLGASLKPLTKQGTTVLAEALLRGRMDVAEALVSHGADVNARCNGYTLLQVLLVRLRAFIVWCAGTRYAKQ